MAITSNDIGSLAADSQSLDKLRYQAKQAPEQALKTAAKQFEVVFLNMMLKSMREATPQDGMFDSEQTKMFTGMLDQQLAQDMSNRGVGLADIMAKQLSRSLPANSNATTAPVTLNPENPLGQQFPVGAGLLAKNYRQQAGSYDGKSANGLSGMNVIPSAYKPEVQQSFVNSMRMPAEQASRSSGIPAHLILGQAALESGWGKREIRMADGSPSYNLFGIKAGKGWNGKVADVTTTEYQNGVAHKQVQRFRAYASYAEGFQDYTRLLSNNHRYATVLQQQDGQGFAQALQQAGYATDPHYAEKLAQVIVSINTKA